MRDLTQPQKPPLFTVREYGTATGDWQMVAAWWASHTAERAIVETLLPPVGVVVERDGEPVAACWCHLSAGIGIAFLESPVARPGLRLSETTAALGTALEAIEAICRTHDYGVLFANTLPGIARVLEKRYGFARAGDRVQMVKRIN